MLIGVVKDSRRSATPYLHSVDGYYCLSNHTKITPSGGYLNVDSLLRLKGLTRKDVNFIKGNEPK